MWIAALHRHEAAAAGPEERSQQLAFYLAILLLARN
jgi:hypothetical protein